MLLRGCESWVACEEKRLEELSTTQDDDSNINCFIPSEAGKTYSITHINKSDYDFSVKLYIDGRLAQNFVSRKGGTLLMVGQHTSSTIIQPFIFSKLNVTDDEDIMNSSLPTSLLKIGYIELIVERISDIHITNEEWLPQEKDFISGTDAIHEKQKKAGSHCTTLGEAKTVNPTYRATCKYLDDAASPYITFSFQYRPLPLLQAQEIAPAPAEVVISERSKRRGGIEESEPGQKRRRSDTLNSGSGSPKHRSPSRNLFGSSTSTKTIKKEKRSNNLDTLKRELKAMKNKMKTVQDNIDRLEESSPRRSITKREVSPIYVGFADGEVIDLTKD